MEIPIGDLIGSIFSGILFGGFMWLVIPIIGDPISIPEAVGAGVAFGAIMMAVDVWMD